MRFWNERSRWPVKACFVLNVLPNLHTLHMYSCPTLPFWSHDFLLHWNFRWSSPSDFAISWSRSLKSQPQPKPSLQWIESLAPSEWYISTFHIFVFIVAAQGYGWIPSESGRKCAFLQKMEKRALLQSNINHRQYNRQASEGNNFGMAISCWSKY